MSAKTESLAIPTKLRAEVDDRDGLHCRVCGEYLGKDRRALHHARYGGSYTGMGGRRDHDLGNIITVGWLAGQDCHSVLHGNKSLWLPYVLQAIEQPGVTVLQLYRWDRKVMHPGRVHRDVRRSGRRLTSVQRAEVREALDAGVAPATLAQEYEVSTAAIAYAKSGRTWRINGRLTDGAR